MKATLLALAAVMSLGSVSAAFAQDGAAGGEQPAAEKAPARPNIYDEKADARKQIDAALAKAKKENRRVLIQWGANWCGWCHLLHEHMEKEKDVRRKLLYEYDVVLVDIGKWDKNLDLVKQYGANFQDPQAGGVPYLTVLDADGSVLANQETGSLESKVDGKNGHDAAKVLAFLTKNQAAYLPAESILSDALRQAKAEDKTVLLHFGAPWCSWCHRLENWLARPEVAAILAKDFVDVKIDTDRTIGGKQMLEKMTKGVQSGIPWFAFLDANGEVVADSFVAAGQNLGYPYTDEEMAAFAEMLERVSNRISDEEMKALVADLRSTNAKKKE